MQIEPTLITACSTLMGVGITLFFTSKRERGKFTQDVRLKHVNDLEALYIEMIAAFEKAIRCTERNLDFNELVMENAKMSAKAHLYAPKNILNQLDTVTMKLYAWSSEYRQSMPTKIEGTRYGMASNLDYIHREKADELFPEVQKEISELINLIKDELDSQRKGL